MRCFFFGLKEDIGKQLIYNIEARFEEIVNMKIMHEIMYPESKHLAVVREEPKTKGGEKRKFPFKGKIKQAKGGNLVKDGPKKF